MSLPSSAPLIAIATCDPLLPDGDGGDGALVQALRDRGARVAVVSWSDPDFDWDLPAVTVLRSTWDYTLRRDEFLAWADRVPRLHNPAVVVRANSSKTYLQGLADAGLPVVPTVFIAPGDPIVLPEAGEFVAKPAVGAGSRGAGRFDADRPGERDRALAHVHELHGHGRTVLVQPYLVEVDTAGETAMVFLEGEFSHAVRKGRMLAEGAGYAADSKALFIEENIEPRTPSHAELDVAHRILAHLAPHRPLLYARIDLLPGDQGPVLVEAELTEPSLFFDHAPGSAATMADAVLVRAGGR